MTVPSSVPDTWKSPGRFLSRRYLRHIARVRQWNETGATCAALRSISGPTANRRICARGFDVVHRSITGAASLLRESVERVGAQVQSIAEQVATGDGLTTDYLSAVRDLGQAKLTLHATVLVAQTLDNLASDLLSQPRRVMTAQCFVSVQHWPPVAHHAGGAPRPIDRGLQIERFLRDAQPACDLPLFPISL